MGCVSLVSPSAVLVPFAGFTFCITTPVPCAQTLPVPNKAHTFCAPAGPQCMHAVPCMMARGSTGLLLELLPQHGIRWSVACVCARCLLALPATEACTWMQAKVQIPRRPETHVNQVEPAPCACTNPPPLSGYLRCMLLRYALLLPLKTAWLRAVQARPPHAPGRMRMRSSALPRCCWRAPAQCRFRHCS